MCIPSYSAPRAPASFSFSSGCPCLWAFRTSAIIAAVCTAVPDGASSFRSWCNSMISTSGIYLAACLDKTIKSTAPMAKFGAINAGVPSFSAAARISSFCPSESPVVPTTGDTLLRSAVITLSKTTSGRVKSIMTSGFKRCRASVRLDSTKIPFSGRPTSFPVSSPPLISTAPTSFSSESSCTAFKTACPMRPQAPFTNTVTKLCASYYFPTHKICVHCISCPSFVSRCSYQKDDLSFKIR